MVSRPGDDRLCRVQFYGINRRRPASHARSPGHRSRRAVDDGLGAASDSVQSVDRAGKLEIRGLQAYPMRLPRRRGVFQAIFHARMPRSSWSYGL